mgnify:CR=1 FL=1
MKHSLRITLLMLFIFFITQLIGLAITKEYLNVNEFIDPDTKEITRELETEALPYNLERPQVEESTSYIWIVAAIIIGTLLLLLLIKYKRFNLWKLWFFLAVFFTMAVAFSAFIQQEVAALLAFVLAILKVYKPQTIIQNITEVFIYGGLAAIFVPVINLFAAFMLLIVISVYDIIAVNKTKHMVKLAKFQAESKVFAGLMLQYDNKKEKPTKKTKVKKAAGIKLAVLGGGDIGFPLIFAGVVMKDLMLSNPELIGFLKTLIIPLFTTLALMFLLFKGKQNKFYPAMPYLTAGCFIGYSIILLFF